LRKTKTTASINGKKIKDRKLVAKSLPKHKEKSI